MDEQLARKISHQGLSRREFLKTVGLTGLALLTGCAGAQKELKDPSEFDIKKFVI